jgi:hypothetical protein
MVARAQRPDPGRRLAGAALVALAFVGVGFAYWELRVVRPVRMPGRITAANADLFSAYLPVHDYAYRRGALLPLWNPHQLAGTPFRANANGILYPPNLVGMLVPTERALGLVSAFHVALAAMGHVVVRARARCVTARRDIGPRPARNPANQTHNDRPTSGR